MRTSAHNSILIAYFSRPGSNYANGRIVDLPIGNTEVVAHRIHELSDGGLFRIKTIKEYPVDYTETTRVSKEELRKNARPELAKKVDDISSYDIIFLGYPNWWGTAPMAVFTFLESHDLSGKIVLPFCTHEGSGMGRSENDIRTHCPDALVKPGLALLGSAVNQADREIEKWIQQHAGSTISHMTRRTKR